MRKINKIIGLSAIMILLFLFYGFPLNAETVYDNSTPVGFGALFQGQKFGNQVTLGGTDRYITGFTFQVYPFTRTFMEGDESLRISFYQNDGTPMWQPGVPQQLYAPSSLIWSSNPISGLKTMPFQQDIFVNVPNVLVPNTFTWVMEVDFGANYHNQPNNMGGWELEAVNFVVAYPPTIGSIDTSWFWWWQPGDMMNPPHWGTLGFGNYNSHYAIITTGSGTSSVPEPTTMLLLGLGLVGLAGIRRKMK